MIRFPQLKKKRWNTGNIQFLEEYAKTHINKKREADTPEQFLALWELFPKKQHPIAQNLL